MHVAAGAVASDIVHFVTILYRSNAGFFIPAVVYSALRNV